MKKRITLLEDFYFVALPSKCLLLIWPLRECLHKLRAKTARPAIPAKICNGEKIDKRLWLFRIYDPGINHSTRGLEEQTFASLPPFIRVDWNTDFRNLKGDDLGISITAVYCFLQG